MIAALFVDPAGPYADMQDVDPWPAARDARAYPGPHPVVAHPPCARWCRFAALVEHRHGIPRGMDGGCFAAALRHVRTYGGVLEHPAYSDAWPAHQLLTPPTSGGWVTADFYGGWTTYVEQRHYGHTARKATWLYAVGTALPRLPWEPSTAKNARTWRRGFGPVGNGDAGRSVELQSRRQRILTPPPFRDLLLDMARSVRQGAAP